MPDAGGLLVKVSEAWYFRADLQKGSGLLVMLHATLARVTLVED